MPDRIRILCVDDHPLMREGIAALIAKEADLVLVAEASSGLEGIQQFREHRPDVTLLDIRLPDISGIDALIAIRKEDSGARVIMFTTSQGDVEIQRALRAGARGYMLKSTPPRELLDAIRNVHRGLTRIPADVATHLAENLAAAALTARELEVLSSMASGNRNREIAATLGITEMTVKIHVRHVMEKLGARDRTEAVAIGLRRGIIHL
ncbi:MAG TPA: response regulator transcription factor [Thermoanaerobaculia bacterium]|jgi:DNA-binding NarL/FixJ family response regulator|nr:response regulator transcription factor [Thermoanaerobaculia bacterium]